MGAIVIKLQQLVNYSQGINVHYLLAKYFLANLSDVDQLSISKVVGDTQVSKTSVLKFCNYLGYDSWKKFSSDFVQEHLDEQLRLDCLKMNAKVTFLKNDMSEYCRLNDEFYQMVQAVVMIEEIDKVATLLHDASDIMIIGNIRELFLFQELQDLLSLYHQDVAFPRLLNKAEFDKQLNRITLDTLVIACDGILSFEGFCEREMIDPIYHFDKIRTTNCQIIYIGQESGFQDDNVTVIGFPFSFNEYFIRLMIMDFVYKVVTYYAHKY